MTLRRLTGVKLADKCEGQCISGFGSSWITFSDFPH